MLGFHVAVPKRRHEVCHHSTLHFLDNTAASVRGRHDDAVQVVLSVPKCVSYAACGAAGQRNVFLTIFRGVSGQIWCELFFDDLLEIFFA